jgi:hypothetical protein
MMGRIRTVKPELFTHEDLFELEQLTKLPIRVSFIGLFTCCDREGRFKWRPKTLKLYVAPYDDCDFSRVLDALMTRGFVVKYEVNGEEFGYMPTFNKHQVINNRESDSELPNPATGLILDASATREPRDDHADTGEGKGKERKGREGERKEIAQAPKFDFLKSLLDLNVEEKNALAWIQVRKAKRAPNTDVALQALIREADKAGLPVNDAVLLCAERNWQSFKAEWILPKSTGVPAVNHPSGLGVHGQATARAAQEWLASKERERNGQQ